MNARAIHSPTSVDAFRNALALESTRRLEAALADLNGFRQSYFATGDVGSFTRLEIETFLEDRRRRHAPGCVAVSAYERARCVPDCPTLA